MRKDIRLQKKQMPILQDKKPREGDMMTDKLCFNTEYVIIAGVLLVGAFGLWLGTIIQKIKHDWRE